MRGWDFLWLLAPTALWGFVLIPRRSKLRRSPNLPAGASQTPLSLAPAPVSATDPCDAPDGNQYSVAVPARSGASVAVLSDFERARMRINREAAERLYGGAA